MADPSAAAYLPMTTKASIHRISITSRGASEHPHNHATVSCPIESECQPPERVRAQGVGRGGGEDGKSGDRVIAWWVLRRYLDVLPDQCRREHVCDVFMAELLLPHAAVLASVAVLIQVHAGGPGSSEATLDQLARCMASTYDVSLTEARISVADSLGSAGK